MSALHALHDAAHFVVAAEPTNPFNGVVPDFTVFGAEFNTAWKKILGGLWALAFAAIAAYCVSATVKFASAKKQGYEHGITESARDLKNAGIAAGVCAGLPIIFSAILSVIG
ncbi:hypothetical protein GCM10010168_51390 [Actinoplanes ianthinogenes]|uniref:Integral membrane protein n=1 Tax=Actinoplanes ianthinogenes TaxID=122358 RepID=A0ABM7M3J0_9ACTN|nr:hypothetical protein [Actinoplanes ianthinogenes]BCJ46190.1 hypothetical protein Aiant_68470 [Actinoplanes ianthinogenes]GGR26924.1 hypothetical protein GCM10010168_51390 [Actinoplanes ianthinogenes]